jgi:hypothetical protein
MVKRIVPALLLIAVAAPAAAQNEAVLKSYFEGKRITVRLDMPGDADGVDVHADARIALDYGKYKDKLKRYGTAIHSGDTVVVTLVKVKKDLIEFQLGGGGFAVLYLQPPGKPVPPGKPSRGSSPAVFSQRPATWRGYVFPPMCCFASPADDCRQVHTRHEEHGHGNRQGTGGAVGPRGTRLG